MPICIKILILSVLISLGSTSSTCDGTTDCENKTDPELIRKPVKVIGSNYVDKSEECDSTCSSSSEEDFMQQMEKRPDQRQVVQNQNQAQQFQPAFLASSYPNVDELGFGTSNYNEVLYPHVHPKLLASYSSGYNVNTLPPVLSTYIHGLIPQEVVQRNAYELDVISPRNKYLPRISRNVRILRDAEDDFLVQLQHDAVMNNILPTMPVPFARYAAPVYSAGGVQAVFPDGRAAGCAQPILFSCSPKIIRGTLKPVGTYYQAPVYRKEAGASEMSSQIHGEPVKVDLTSKTVVLAEAKCPPDTKLGSDLQCIPNISIPENSTEYWKEYP